MQKNSHKSEVNLGLCSELQACQSYRVNLSQKKRGGFKPVMVMHTFKYNTQKAEAGGRWISMS